MIFSKYTGGRLRTDPRLCSGFRRKVQNWATAVMAARAPIVLAAVVQLKATDSNGVTPPPPRNLTPFPRLSIPKPSWIVKTEVIILITKLQFLLFGSMTRKGFGNWKLFSPIGCMVDFYPCLDLESWRKCKYLISVHKKSHQKVHFFTVI